MYDAWAFCATTGIGIKAADRTHDGVHATITGPRPASRLCVAQCGTLIKNGGTVQLGWRCGLAIASAGSSRGRQTPPGH